MGWDLKICENLQIIIKYEQISALFFVADFVVILKLVLIN